VAQYCKTNSNWYYCKKSKYVFIFQKNLKTPELTNGVKQSTVELGIQSLSITKSKIIIADIGRHLPRYLRTFFFCFLLFLF